MKGNFGSLIPTPFFLFCKKIQIYIINLINVIINFFKRDKSMEISEARKAFLANWLKCGEEVFSVLSGHQHVYGDTIMFGSLNLLSMVKEESKEFTLTHIKVVAEPVDGLHVFNYSSPLPVTDGVVPYIPAAAASRAHGYTNTEEGEFKSLKLKTVITVGSEDD